MGGEVNIPYDKENWSKEWKTIEYKKYKTNKKIKLLPFSECKITETYADLLEKRKSERDFSKNMYEITLQDLSSILVNSISLKKVGVENSNRFYPSPGALFPVEIYIYVNRSKEIPFGVYYYNFLENCLELVNDNFTSDKLRIGGEHWFKDSSVMIIMTVVMQRIMQKYGERGYRYALIEAGHIGQNIYLAATAKKIKVCACGGIFESELERILFIDGKNECGIYAIALG